MDAPLKMQKLQVLGRLFRKFPKSPQICTFKQGSCTESSIVPKTRNIRCISTSSRLQTEAQIEFNRNIQVTYKCHDNDPLNLSIDQESLFYNVPKEELEKYLKYSLHRQFVRLCDVLNDCSIMVRRPALEMIDYIKQVDFNKPVIKAFFYGRNGCGKTTSLNHVIHYCGKAGFLIVNIKFPSVLVQTYTGYEASNYKEGRIDHPKDAAEWLVQFQSQNSHFLEDLKISKDCIWNKRESSPAGTSFAKMIEFCISRNTYATDCVGILLREIKKLACDKKIKVLASVDGVNGLFRTCIMRNENKKLILNEDITLIRSYKKFIQTNWTNGFIVGTIDELANEPSLRGNYTPHFVLGKKGFDYLDPFIPVLVTKYNKKEMYNCIQYYQDQNWLQHPAAKTKKGVDEIIFLSDHNPYTLTRVCGSR